MDALCGLLRLDGQPIARQDLSDCIGNLRPQSAAPTHAAYGFQLGSMALGHLTWGQHASASNEAWAYHQDSRTLVIADARLEQRRALIRSLNLSTDAEWTTAQLVLQAWLRWGVDCAEQLRGDFALAVWDQCHQSLYCARDILGVRPLYLCHQPGQMLAFASRAAALTALPGVADDLDEGRIADALVPQLEGIDKTSTFVKQIKRLPPAHWLRVDASGLRRQRYWQPGAARMAVPRSSKNWASALNDTLRASVQQHLDDGHVTACMVSGGLDSSALAVTASELSSQAGLPPLITTSRVADDPDEPETKAIHRVLQSGRYAAQIIDPSRLTRMQGRLQPLLEQPEEPFDASMSLVASQYLAAAEAGADALMDGIDADILLSEGSTLIRQMRKAHFARAWRNIRGLQQVYPGFSAWHYALRLAYASWTPSPLRRVLGKSPAQRSTEAIQSSFIAADFANRINLQERMQRFRQWSTATLAGEAIQQAVAALDHSYTTCGLERYHRVAAHFGVQPRHPYANRDLLDLCVNLPDSQRLDNGWTKLVLRRTMQGRLPDAVCWRRGKQHLGWQTTRQLLGSPPALRAELEAQHAILAPFVDLRRLKQALEYDNGVLQPRVVGVLALARWLQHRPTFATKGIFKKPQIHWLDPARRSRFDATAERQ